MRYYLLLVITLVYSRSSAQLFVSGVVSDQKSRENIPFASIGIKEKNLGTISSEEGKFTLIIPAANLNDTLTISAIGYSSLMLPICGFDTNRHEFLLNPQTTSLQSFTVAAKETQLATYGLWRTPLIHFVDASEAQNDAYEIAQLLHLGKPGGKIKTVNLLVSESRDDSALFRINFYRYDGRRPSMRAVERSIIVKKAVKQGWMSFDISSYDIYLAGDIVVGIELFPGMASGKTISYDIKPGGYGSFVRRSSLGAWQVPPARYRMYVTVRTAKPTFDIDAEEKEPFPSFTLYSENVGDSFSVFVKLPVGYNEHPDKKYSTVYLLDANLYFPYLRDSMEKMNTGQQILVGVGYRSFVEMNTLRDRDYTYPRWRTSDGSNFSGGGNLFYQFFVDELVPYIDRHYRCDTAYRCLAGHSLGGYFTLYALLRAIQENRLVFKEYVAASPSLDYHNEYLLRKFRKLGNDKLNVKLFVTWGEREALERNDGRSYGDIMNEFTGLLNSPPLRTISCQYKIYPEADHMEVAMPTFYETMHRTGR